LLYEHLLYKIIGQRIKTYRIAKHLTQEQVSEKLQMSRPSVTNIESGKHRIQIHVLYELAELFEIPIQDLLVINFDCENENLKEIVF